MPTSTYTPLANITLGSAAASVTFSSISQAYRDLILVIAGTQSVTETVLLRINGDTGANYNIVEMGYSNTGGTYSGAASNRTYHEIIYTDPAVLYNAQLSIMDYSATDKHKTILTRSNSPSTAGSYTAFLRASAGRWASTSAITSIVVYPNSGTFSTGFTATLFGVAA